VIVSDMTGTIINQEHDGFSKQQRENISFLLDQGTKIVLVTADPLSAVKEHFVEKLQYKGKGELFVLSSAGQEGYKVAPSKSSYTEVCRGPNISVPHRRQLLGSFISALEKAISAELEISDQQRNSLLCGNRMKLQEVNRQIPGQNSAIDIFPGKASIFFLDPDTPLNFINQVFEAIDRKSVV
jgi:hydroxymethylpyrimidine pyrophosphatase-like HAD family hydrolase